MTPTASPETDVYPATPRRRSRVKRVALILLALFAVLVVVVLVAAAMKSDDFGVQRTVSIQAPPEKIFPLINDFKKWSWSPFEKTDPAMKRTYSGPESGLGSVYEFDGNAAAGQGRVEIVESTPPSRIRLTLDFERPFKGSNEVVFTLEPQGDSTNVTWAMQGPSPLFSKVLRTVIDMDEMVGSQFEAGLRDLKAIAEQ